MHEKVKWEGPAQPNHGGGEDHRQGFPEIYGRKLEFSFKDFLDDVHAPAVDRWWKKEDGEEEDHQKEDDGDPADAVENQCGDGADAEAYPGVD